MKLEVIDYENNLKEITEVEAQINTLVADHKVRLEKLQERDRNLRDELKEAMKREGIKKYDSEYLTLTYIAESNRTSIDTKKLKEEKPELWNEYSKTTPVADSVRIKIKENE